MKLETNPETFQLKYLTAKLWMEYMYGNGQHHEGNNPIWTNRGVVSLPGNTARYANMPDIIINIAIYTRVPIRVPKVDD